MGNIYINLKKLVFNTGQIEGVPRNPREWTKEDVSRLAASIVETPELFEARPLLVVPRGERFVVIGGNMRLAAARELAMDAPPCYEIQDRSVDNLKRMAIKDNSSFGEWDMDLLDEEWGACPLKEWGVTIPEKEPSVVSEPETGEMTAGEIAEKKREFEERMAAGEIDEGDEEYQAFLDKFVPKKTTDDCYTPDLVYEAVAQWVANEYHVAPRHFVRPFYPGGDYQREQYLPDAIVVDNPPFSILSEIIKFYVEKGIRFFLFAPTLTLFSSSSLVTALPMAATVTYENKANVNTSFVTNLEDPSIRLRSVPSLYRAVKEANDRNLEEQRRELPKYAYPDNVVTSAFVARLSRYGIDFSVSRAESVSIDALDAQKEQGRAIYGKGYLVSERAAAERAAAIRFALSPREREIVAQLGKAGNNE